MVVLVVSYKVKHTSSIRSHHSIHCYVPKRSENMFIQNLYSNVHCSFIQNCQNLEINQVLISCGEIKKKTCYIPFLAMKWRGLLTDTHANMEESQKHYAKWKNTNIKHSIMLDSIYMKFCKMQNCRDKMQISDCQGPELRKRYWFSKCTRADFFGVL